MWPKWKENELAEIIQMKRDYQIVAFHQGEQWFEWCPLRSSAWMRRAQQRDASSHSSSTDNSLDLIISSRGNVGESPSRFKLQVRAVEEKIRTVLQKQMWIPLTWRSGIQPVWGQRWHWWGCQWEDCTCWVIYWLHEWKSLFSTPTVNT